jgi:hypothetical protein
VFVFLLYRRANGASTIANFEDFQLLFSCQSSSQ